jgi:hypothetical protein
MSARCARRPLSAAAAVLLLGGLSAACRQDMHDQPKYKPYRQSALFQDGRAARPFVAGTIARGQLREDEVFFTGKQGGKDFVTELPMKVTPQLLARGQEQYQVFCSPCHGRTGRGDGMIVQRGFKPPNSYHTDRVRGMPPASDVPADKRPELEKSVAAAKAPEVHH